MHVGAAHPGRTACGAPATAGDRRQRESRLQRTAGIASFSSYPPINDVPAVCAMSKSGPGTTPSASTATAVATTVADVHRNAGRRGASGTGTSRSNIANGIFR